MSMCAPFLPALHLVSSATSAPPPVDSPNLRLTILMAALFVFVLAIFEGFEIINKVPPTLHTPLMSGSNAISGITIVGALICADSPMLKDAAPILGCLAIAFAAINVVGGYLVTDRMLRMFRRK